MSNAIKSFSAFCLLFLFSSLELAAQSREVQEENIEKNVTEVFEAYMNASWTERAELMTESAYKEFVGGMIVAYQAKATKLLETEYDINDFEFPEYPADYRYLPGKDAIDKAKWITAKFVDELKGKLGDRFGEFADQLADQLNQFDNAPRLHSIKLGEDGATATADCRIDGADVDIPFRFRLEGDNWKFDGKDELLFFDRQR